MLVPGDGNFRHPCKRSIPFQSAKESFKDVSELAFSVSSELSSFVELILVAMCIEIEGSGWK